MTDSIRLPGIAGELQRHCSLDAAIALVNWKGGAVLYVPERYAMGHPIEQHCGRQAFEWLIENYPHEYIQVPRCHHAMIRCKDARIHELHREQGASLAELARKYGMTIRGIQLSVQRHEDRVSSGERPQQDLFGLS